MDQKFLNDVLVQQDIMRTGHDCFDGTEVAGALEYMPEAGSILRFLDDGNSANEAVAQAFAARFDAANLSAEQRKDRLRRLSRTLQEQLRLDVRRRRKPVLRKGRLDAESLELLLWQADPMGTCCHMHEGMEREYQGVAREIVQRIDHGQTFASALEATFDNHFGEGCLTAEHRVASVESLGHKVRALIGKASKREQVELSQEFFNTVFTDAFIFGGKPSAILKQTQLSTYEKRLAMRIRKSSNYNEETWEDCDALVDRLSGYFHWQNNSEGPAMFCSTILYFLDLEQQDVEWFITKLGREREKQYY